MDGAVPGADMLMNMNLPEMESVSLDFGDVAAEASTPASPAPPPKLVPSAAEIGPTKSWDGIENLNADAYLKPVREAPRVSEDALMKEKYEILRKFDRLQKLGVPIRKRFTMDSPLDEMKMELEFIRKEKAMDATIKQFSEWFITGMSAMEWGSKNINALKMFGLQLDGLSQSAQMNVGDLEEDFEELYDLYGDKMRMHPLVRIPMRTCIMVYMVHLTNQMAMKAPVPNIQEILRQNPEIGRQLAAEAMKGQTAQFKAQANVPVPTYTPGPTPQAQMQQSNPLSGLMSFLGGTQQSSPPPQTVPAPQTQTRKVTMPSKPVQMPQFLRPAAPPPKKELPPPSGAGIADILKGLQAEQKAAPPLKSALKKTPTSSAGKSPKNSVVIKL
uniref:Uncharacterized protein n=1 Tax=viral metagenome TaxID=1070528 RepID=A0A6C0I7V6_9ZZZZ